MAQSRLLMEMPTKWNFFERKERCRIAAVSTISLSVKWLFFETKR